MKLRIMQLIVLGITCMVPSAVLANDGSLLSSVTSTVDKTVQHANETVEEKTEIVEGTIKVEETAENKTKEDQGTHESQAEQEKPSSKSEERVQVADKNLVGQVTETVSNVTTVTTETVDETVETVDKTVKVAEKTVVPVDKAIELVEETVKTVDKTIGVVDKTVGTTVNKTVEQTVEGVNKTVSNTVQEQSSSVENDPLIDVSINDGVSATVHTDIIDVDVNSDVTETPSSTNTQDQKDRLETKVEVENGRSDSHENDARDSSDRANDSNVMNKQQQEINAQLLDRAEEQDSKDIMSENLIERSNESFGSGVSDSPSKGDHPLSPLDSVNNAVIPTKSSGPSASGPGTTGSHGSTSTTSYTSGFLAVLTGSDASSNEKGMLRPLENGFFHDQWVNAPPAPPPK
ncbi:hypothetical protein [Pseudalkalibacillus decolorationis]|uniref:hypothetical protein n=1 Tax=Pseudalkalibacillus decolorationis TaxID=163879 RepID=UPI0021473A88|nr:hypothetical protein [Pseudalkalibacillus decolorationis]